MADTMSDVNEAVKDQAQEAKDTIRQAIESPPEGRVEWSTLEEINRQMRRDLEARVLYFAERPEDINRRLEELDREWDIERLLEANAGILSLMGLTFGVVRSRWYLLPLAAGAFLVQYAFQGWCPPVSVFRRLGVRTTREINHERYALKALRGDFESVRMEGDEDPQERARRAIDAADMNL
jgi:hypothetical protein